MGKRILPQEMGRPRWERGRVMRWDDEFITGTTMSKIGSDR